MKKHPFYIILFFVSILSILSFSAKAQHTILVGTIINSSTGKGIPNKSVTLVSKYDTVHQTGINYHHTSVTNGQGYFYDTVAQVSPNTLFIASVLDCNQQIVQDTFNSSIPALLSISICSNMNICNADFFAFPDTSDYKKTFFTNLSIGQSLSHIWTFGDGFGSSMKNPIHTYANDGAFEVTLTITSPTCVHTYVDTVVVSPQLTCKARFQYTIMQQQSAVDFRGAVNNAYLNFYQWDFGDGSHGSGKNITHQYNSSGSFQVTLSTTSVHSFTHDTCVSYTTKTVHLPAPLKGDIYGQVFMDSLSVKDAKATLYRLQLSDSTLIYTDTVSITSVNSLNLSYYYFEDVIYGNYVVKAELNSTSANFHNYAPAYSGNTLFWNEIQGIYLNSTLNSGASNSINLTDIYPGYGSAQVSGFVYEGSYHMPGNPVGNASVYLLDDNQLVKDFVISDPQTGSFSFQQLENREYSIYVDYVNYYPNRPVFEPSIHTQSFTHQNVYLEAGQPVSIASSDVLDKVKIYPNPAKGKLYIEFASYDSNIEIEIFSVFGQSIKRELLKNISELDRKEVDISNIHPGVYILECRLSNGTKIDKKIVVQ